MESICSFALPFRPFGLGFTTPRASNERIVISSFDTSETNFIKSYKIDGGQSSNEVDLPIALPQTRVMFSPCEGPNENNIATAGDCLRLMTVSDGTIELISEMPISDSNDPITCIDWIADDETQIIAGSTDATATAVDITTGATTAKLVAHDHPVHDICYCGSSSTFVTAGFDGSLRFFDLRDQMSSFIYFQTAMPLLRASVCPPNKIALFAKGSHSATIVDIRRPCMPCGFGVRGTTQVTGVAWSQTNPNILFSSDAEGNFSMANTETGEETKLYEAGAPIESFVLGEGKVAIACNGKVDILRLPQ